jgi:hypothetical protein
VMKAADLRDRNGLWKAPMAIRPTTGHEMRIGPSALTHSSIMIKPLNLHRDWPALPRSQVQIHYAPAERIVTFSVPPREEATIED